MQPPTYTIQPITLEALPSLQALFSEACGYEVNVQDEIDYFKASQPQDGLMVLQAEQVIGYLRAFPCGPTLHIADFFVSDRPDALEIKKALLVAYQHQSSCPARLRIDLSAGQHAEQALLTFLGYRVYQAYDSYTWEAPSDLPVVDNVRFASENDDFTRILACLSHWDNLNEQSLRAAATAKGLVIYTHQQEAVGACLLNHSTQEIIQIATHENHKRQGYAYRLIQGLPKLYPQASFYLKVEQKNRPAQRLYQKLGFKKDVSKNEVWMLKSLK